MAGRIQTRRKNHSIFTPAGRKYVCRRIWMNRYMYLMILPIVAYFVIIRYIPMWYLRIAFYDYKLLKGFAGSKFVGFKHFANFINSMNFTQLVGNTVLLNIMSLVFSFPFPIIFALFLNEIKNTKFRKVVQTISYLPHFLSTVIIVSMLNTLLSVQTGAVNAAFRAVGLETIYFMGDPHWFRPLYILSGIWQGTGWGSIIYMAALSAVDPQLHEAAMVDGATRFQRLLHIDLPAIVPTITITLILRFGSIMGIGFDKAFLMQNDTNLAASEVISTYVYKVGLTSSNNMNYSYSTAIGLFNSVINLIMISLVNFTSNRINGSGLW